jgi:Rhodopirellula transposase DDE domain
VCHYPAGTSKWNKIEHRMFCHITQTWRGKPLVSPSRSSNSSPAPQPKPA